MINQNRMAALEDKRAELSLQISLLAEHETTRLISMVEAIQSICRRRDGGRPRTPGSQEEVPPEQVLSEIEKKQG